MSKFVFILIFSIFALAQAEDTLLEDAPVVAEPVRDQARMPAAAITPQRFVDKEMGIACYYLAPSDSNGVVSMYAAINCVKLDDPDEKLAREQERRERAQDRTRTQTVDRSIEDRESYEENQKQLQLMRKKSK